mgnify:CR=1 FL=1
MLKSMRYILLCATAALSANVWAGYIIVYPKHSSKTFKNSFLPICGRCEIRMEKETSVALNATLDKPTVVLDGITVEQGVTQSIPVHDGSSFDLKASGFASFVLYNNSDYDISSDCTSYECPSSFK